MAERPLTHTKIIKEIAEELDAPQTFVKDVLFLYQDIMLDEISEGRPFSLPAVFKIFPSVRGPQAARMGRNPQTGEQIQIKAKPSSITVRIRALKDLKEAAPSKNSKVGRELLKAHKEKNSK